MKLIIDIEKDYYEIIKYKVEHGDDYKPYSLIANGISYEERSQGEWEEPFEHNGKMYHKCNHCHISSPLMLIDNYCSYCGAEMRKEGNE